MTLTLGIVALLLGPFIYAIGQRKRHFRQFLDGFVFITIAGIVCVHIIPDTIGAGGMWALMFLLLGLAFPIFLEKAFHSALHEAHIVVVILAALGLILHATIDGIALLPFAADHQHHDHDFLYSIEGGPLALGVILHRLPVGMVIWWSVRPHFGTPTAILVFAVMIVATVLAYVMGTPVLEMTESQFVTYFTAFVSGSLVHVVAFGISHDHGGLTQEEEKSSPDQWPYRLGILIGLFMVFTLPHTLD